MIELENSTKPETKKKFHHPTFGQYKKKSHQFILRNNFKSEKSNFSAYWSVTSKHFWFPVSP